jgi:hypothetical protein
MVESRLVKGVIVGALLLAAPWVRAQTNPDWTTPIAPFHIGGNLYYVGGKDLASAITMPAAPSSCVRPALSTWLWTETCPWSKAAARRILPLRPNSSGKNPT